MRPRSRPRPRPRAAGTVWTGLRGDGFGGEEALSREALAGGDGGAGEEDVTEIGEGAVFPGAQSPSNFCFH